MRRFVPANEISPTDSRKVGLFVEKMSRFHSHMHRSAEGIPEEIEVPAPRSMLNGLSRFTARARTKASSSSRGDVEMGIRPKPIWEHDNRFPATNNFKTKGNWDLRFRVLSTMASGDTGGQIRFRPANLSKSIDQLVVYVKSRTVHAVGRNIGQTAHYRHVQARKPQKSYNMGRELRG
jgi:hypothetical protein